MTSGQPEGTQRMKKWAGGRESQRTARCPTSWDFSRSGQELGRPPEAPRRPSIIGKRPLSTTGAADSWKRLRGGRATAIARSCFPQGKKPVFGNSIARNASVRTTIGALCHRYFRIRARLPAGFRAAMTPKTPIAKRYIPTIPEAHSRGTRRLKTCVRHHCPRTSNSQGIGGPKTCRPESARSQGRYGSRIRRSGRASAESPPGAGPAHRRETVRPPRPS